MELGCAELGERFLGAHGAGKWSPSGHGEPRAMGSPGSAHRTRGQSQRRSQGRVGTAGSPGYLEERSILLLPVILFGRVLPGDAEERSVPVLPAQPRVPAAVDLRDQPLLQPHGRPRLRHRGPAAKPKAAPAFAFLFLAHAAGSGCPKGGGAGDGTGLKFFTLLHFSPRSSVRHPCSGKSDVIEGYSNGKSWCLQEGPPKKASPKFQTLTMCVPMYASGDFRFFPLFIGSRRGSG